MSQNLNLTAIPLCLLGLLVAWAVLLFGGIFFRSGKKRVSTAMRMVSSLMLVVAGWGWYFSGTPGGATAYTILIAIGMTFGLLGDLCMARLLPIRENVMAGMAAFGTGHVAYIAAGLTLAGILGLSQAGPRIIAWLGWLVAGTFGWFLAVYRPNRAKPQVITWVALLYALLLASTAGVATGIALQDGRFWPLALGAGLFLLSDLILAAGLFSGARIRRQDQLVWLTYGPGQMLIVYATAAMTLRN